MRGNFDVSIQYVLNDEGGFVIRENEPGGSVNKGVSMLVFQEWRKATHRPVPSVDDLRNLSDEEAADIYDAKFARPIGFDTLPGGLDYALLNTAVMQGPTGAIKLLQEALSLPVTGKMDSGTINKIQSTNAYESLGSLLMNQMKAKMNDPRVGPHADSKGKSMRGFGPGWANRIIRVWNRSIRLV